MTHSARGDLPVINLVEALDSIELCSSNSHGSRFEARFAAIGKALGTKKLGINLTVVAAGKRAWPRHYHFANDELFIVIEGKGRLYYGERSGPIGKGDVIYIEAGTGIPFAIENDSKAELSYLAIDPQIHPDVFVYPDSGKVGFVAGGPPLREAAAPLPKIARFVTEEMNANYWDGEPGAQD